MRCGYCYNPELVFGKGTLTFEEALQFLKTRTGLLDGVVLSGGECLLHRQVEAFVRQIKQLGFLVKIDTNGSRPDVLGRLLQEQLIDFVALDFKAMPTDFKTITGTALFGSFEKSLDLLLSAKIPFEVRTTVHSGQLDQNKINSMRQWLETKGFRGDYHIQHFRNGVETIGRLDHSVRDDTIGALSTPGIRIVIRG